MIVLANVAADEGKPAESAELLTQARSILIERFPGPSQDLMAATMNLASDLEQLGRIDEALAMLAEAERLAIAAVGSDSHNAKAIRSYIVRLKSLSAQQN
jgi:hypothetical protein